LDVSSVRTEAVVAENIVAGTLTVAIGETGEATEEVAREKLSARFWKA
jgi:hypothetical protein